jgi:Ferroportin1 (FPN1)
VAAVVLILAWNMASWLPECLLLRYCQAQMPELCEPKAGRWGRLEAAAKQHAEATPGLLGCWAVYLRQRTLPAALSLAMLYLTVMCFGRVWQSVRARVGDGFWWGVQSNSRMA